MASKWPAKLKLRNGRADCHQIWCVVRDHVAMHIMQVISGVNLHVRTCINADDPPVFRISGGGLH